MRIVVAGVGEVGMHLAKMLANSYHDIVAIDPLVENLEKLEEEADLVTVQGSALSFSILHQAEVEKSDLFIAVAHSEETNIIASILAKRLGAKRVVARIDNNEFLQEENLRYFQEMGVDSLIYPEKLASQVVIGILGEEGALEYIDFCNGKLGFSVFRLDDDVPQIGMTLIEVDKSFKEIDFRIVAIMREGETLIPRGDERLLGGDLIYLVSSHKGIDAFRKSMGASAFHVEDLMVLGGSRIGVRTCLDLESSVKNIKLIESSLEKCEAISDRFNKTLVIHGDGRDTDLLYSEGLEHCDAFVAVTGNSETNIIASMVARRAGVRQIIAEVENLDFISLAESIGIDAVVNKKLIAASNIFHFTMRGDVSSVRYLTGSDAEVIEFVAKEGAHATRGRLKDLNFPKNSIAGGLVRGDEVIIPTGDTQIMPGDRVVVFTLDASMDKLIKFFR